MRFQWAERAKAASLRHGRRPAGRGRPPSDDHAVASAAAWAQTARGARMAQGWAGAAWPPPFFRAQPMRLPWPLLLTMTLVTTPGSSTTTPRPLDTQEGAGGPQQTCRSAHGAANQCRAAPLVYPPHLMPALHRDGDSGGAGERQPRQMPDVFDLPGRLGEVPSRAMRCGCPSGLATQNHHWPG
eukprot:COSAG01_NODE_5411_length_4280_cov_6.071275_5_plen_184_part_00